jgi:hypothetical protein
VTIAVLTVIVMLQNIQPVETRILFLTLTMPRAFLPAGTLAVGFLLGFVTGRRRAGRRAVGGVGIENTR